MKLWEVMRLLEENPTDVYEARLNQAWKVRMTVETGSSEYYKFEVFNGKRLIDQSRGGGAFNGNVALGLDWRLVRQPVTWQEAIQAWADGKKVVWEEDTDRRVFDKNKSRAIPNYQSHLLAQVEDAVTVGMISGGTWYVED